MPKEYAESLDKLINEFKKLPGIGPKSAQRLSFFMMSLPQKEVDEFARVICDARAKLKPCSTCFNITDMDPCFICSNSSRDKSQICVTSEPKDLIAIEKSGSFRGLYHVLGGVISPLSGIGPENLRIKELLKRLGNGTKEVILATNPTTEGEATALYLSRLIKPMGLKVSRLAFGLPMGSDMDYADEMTLSHAFVGRREIN